MASLNDVFSCVNQPPSTLDHHDPDYAVYELRHFCKVNREFEGVRERGKERHTYFRFVCHSVPRSVSYPAALRSADRSQGKSESD
jgi:hypothetical protein